MTSPRTFIDPILLELERSPYGRLAGLGVTPDSSARAVLDASFRMSHGQWSERAVTAAWDRLRGHRTRLVADFLLYELPAAVAAEPAHAAARLIAVPCHLLAAVEHAALTGFRATGIDGPAAELPALPVSEDR